MVLVERVEIAGSENYAAVLSKTGLTSKNLYLERGTCLTSAPQCMNQQPLKKVPVAVYVVPGPSVNVTWPVFKLHPSNLP